MKLKEAILKDGQRHLYVKSAITSRTTQYLKYYVFYHFENLLFQKYPISHTTVIKI